MESATNSVYDPSGLSRWFLWFFPYFDGPGFFNIIDFFSSPTTGERAASYLMVITFILSVLLVGLLSMYFERQIDDKLWVWCTHEQV